MKNYLVIPDQHAHPDHPNDRADWLASLIIDTKPDVVVNIGDAADMTSLATYDKGKRSFHGKSYKKDIESHLDFQERLWGPVKRQKKKLPHRVVLEGNHEHRVERALDLSPELVGTLGFNDFDFGSYYDDVVRYEGEYPGIYEQDGILFAHFFPSGVMGRPVGGERPGYSLLAKNGMSSVQGHIHTFDYSARKTVNGRVLHSLVTGCYQDYTSSWAGVVGNMWRSGVCMLYDVEDGNYDLEFISIDRLKKVYGAA